MAATGRLSTLTWLVAVVCCPAAPLIAQDLPRQSTTGPKPGPEVVPKEQMQLLPNATSYTIAGVPGYLWRHGCGPTAVGMVVGYYDAHGYDDLFAGEASSQTADVNQGIASQGSGVRGSGLQRHYEDYSLPMDSGQPSVLPDSSVAYPDGCHLDDCIADFMHTSWSKDNNFYGWSWSSRIAPSFKGYVTLRNTSYGRIVTQYRMGTTLTWSVLTSEIDNHRPMVFLVDSSGDGSTDHFVTIVGYTDSPAQKYGCLDTWSPATQVRWCEFRPMSSSYSWGVWGGWSFSLRPGRTAVPSPPDGAAELPDVVLGWTNGGGALSYDVYFGTSPTPGPAEFRGNQAGETFDPGLLSPDTTYFWRIDARGEGGGLTTGEVWSFTTNAECVAPQIVVSPPIGTDLICEGYPRLLCTEAAGTHLSYQWQKDLIDVPGAVSPCHLVDQTGVYRCVVSNVCGSIATDDVVLSTTLCVDADVDHDRDVDQSDFGRVQTCLSGVGVVQEDPACEHARLDADGDVDGDDLELFFGCAAGASCPAPPHCLRTWLSDVSPLAVQVGWGQLMLDRNICGFSPISIRGVTYARGVTAHPDSAITYALDGQYSRFEAMAGIDDSAFAANCGQGSVPAPELLALFIVELDGITILSRTVSGLEPASPVQIDVAGASRMVLRTIATGPQGKTACHTVWADARLR